MALIIPGVAIGGISGSAGPLVFSKSFAGPTVRLNLNQIQALSAEQALIKGNITTLSKDWKALTPSQRAAWAVFGEAHPRTTALGQPFALPGNIAFIMVNQSLKSAGITTVLDTPPSLYTAGSPNGITPSWTPSPQTMTVTPNANPGPNEVPIVWSTKPLSPGRTAKKSSFTKVQVFAVATPPPYDITANLLTKVGVFMPGQAFTLKLQYTDQSSGAQGIASIAQLILT